MGQGGETTQRDTDTSDGPRESMGGGEASQAAGGSPTRAPLDLVAAAAAAAADGSPPSAQPHVVPHIQQAYNW